MPVYPDTKQCENECPNCGSTNIDWGRLESDDPPYRCSTCEDCKCDFTEVYTYSCTDYDKNQEGMRKLCEYPMSEFYTFQDEVGPDDRVSTTEDCEACDEEDCDVKYCLMKKET